MTEEITVYIANDQDGVCRLWQRVIDNTAGMRCVGIAFNGEKAVVEVTDLNPDVVLMDIMMPGMDGYEATQQILAVHPHTSVIIFSARSDIHEKAREVGAHAALYMPVTPDQITRTIQDVYAHHKAL